MNRSIYGYVEVEGKPKKKDYGNCCALVSFMNEISTVGFEMRIKLSHCGIHKAAAASNKTARSSSAKYC